MLLIRLPMDREALASLDGPPLANEVNLHMYRGASPNGISTFSILVVMY